MTTGIYKLTFDSGKCYIGQSVYIEKRWDQHSEKLREGKAAKPMQREYSTYGMPKFEILCYCHKDYLDIMEAYWINQYKPFSLNSIFPEMHDCSSLLDTPELLEVGILEYIRRYKLLEHSLNDTCKKLKELRDCGILVPQEILDVQRDNAQMYGELVRIKNLPWWKKIFL